MTQTNLYQRQSTSALPSNMQWKDVSEEEMMAFLGVVVAMRIVNLPELDDYWAILVQLQVYHGFPQYFQEIDSNKLQDIFT